MRAAKFTKNTATMNTLDDLNNINVSNTKDLMTDTLPDVIGRAFIYFIRLCLNTVQALAHTVETLTGYKIIQLPWIKFIFLAFIVFFFVKRDMKLELNLKGNEDLKEEFRSLRLTDDQEKRTNTVKASTASIFTDNPNSNPQAPISPTYLNELQVTTYMKRFKDVAKTEQEKYGVPASINMAQALIESRAGSSSLAKQNNNHFGIKCFSKRCKKGHCSNFSDDHHKDFFRKYGSAWQSWREHSKMLTSGRYKELTKSSDYRDWAKGLAALGYATDSNYEKKLVYIIEQYGLDKLDR